MSKWHVYEKTSLSNHKYVLFQVGELEATKVTYHNPKTTNLETKWEDLKVNLGIVQRVVHSVWDLELAADLVQQAIFFSYHKNCPANVAVPPRRDPWWNKELSHINASARWLFNKDKRTGNWESL